MQASASLSLNQNYTSVYSGQHHRGEIRPASRVCAVSAASFRSILSDSCISNKFGTSQANNYPAMRMLDHIKQSPNLKIEVQSNAVRTFLLFRGVFFLADILFQETSIPRRNETRFLVSAVSSCPRYHRLRLIIDRVEGRFVVPRCTV